MSNSHTACKLTTNGACLVAEGGMPIGMADDYAKSREEQHANAQHIARCWNSHDAMLAVLQKIAASEFYVSKVSTLRGELDAAIALATT